VAFEEYPQVFTPGAPITKRSLLYGREQELRDLQRALSRPGHHPIVIGNRGVGKTSLVQLGLQSLGESVSVYRIGCNARMNFDDFAGDLLTKLHGGTLPTEVEISTSRTVKGSGSLYLAKAEASGSESTTTKLDGPARRKAEPWMLFQAISAHRKRLIIVLDEYDRVSANNRHSKEFHENIADLMKTMADESGQCDSRLVVVGIAQSAKNLLGQHLSIERSAREIYLRPLRKEDIQDFLSTAEEELNFRFAPGIKNDIATSALGYPYFAHLVGLECLDVMTEADPAGRLVEQNHYDSAVSRAVDKAFRTELRKYSEAVSDLTADESNLIALLLRYPRPPTRSIFESHLSTRNVMEPKDFNAALNRLQFDKKLLYVSRNSDILRFSDPLMAPFLKKHPQIAKSRAFLPEPRAAVEEEGEADDEDQRDLFD